MRKYIIKRLLLVIPMLIGISFLLFLVMHLSPSDPTAVRYGLNPEVSNSARENFNKLYGLDKPFLEQYLNWMGRFARMDFGNSFIDDAPVREKILSRLPATLLLEMVSLFVILLISLPLGITSAVKKGTKFDNISTITVFIGYAMPTFWLALVLIYIFGYKLEWFPISGMNPWYFQYLSGFDKIKDVLWHLVLPVAATSFGSLAVLSRYSRSSMIEIMEQQYIMTARAKGLTENRIIYVHALKNALLPVVTILGLSLPGLISGSFIFETIFAWPGMGRLGYEAIMNYDYPVVMGVSVMATLLTLFGILIADITYAFVDPRIRYERKK
ncbi:MAG TPA: ABC transporter permease [Candidatus Omnitrophota bacterium]|nr:ABC transporter permease [Candidatus Omnitrophota bacterium]HPS19579.1 ABC transporter permease [Candidatus Omnitrophota bacterium]